MKIAIFTDLHIADRGSQMKGSVNRLKYCHDFVDWFINYISERGDIDFIINCGDLTSSDNLSAKESTALHTIMTKFGNYVNNNPKVKMYNILGNHERRDRVGSENSINSVEAYSSRIYLVQDEVVIVPKDASPRLHLVAYGNKELYRSMPGRYLFTHEDFYPEGLSQIAGLDHSLVEGYKKVFNGHIHNSQEFGNIVNIGSCLGSNFSDDYSLAYPGIIILDTDHDTIERVKNPVAPLYFTLSSKDDLNILDGINSDRCYIRLVEPDIIKYIDKNKLKEFGNVSVPSVIHEGSLEELVDIKLDNADDIIKYLIEYYKDEKGLVEEVKEIFK